MATAVRKPVIYTAASSATKTVILDDRIRVIGERINPTGKKALREALKAGDYTYVENEAIQQVKAGAEILDINVGVPGIDEKAVMCEVVRRVSAVTDAPLQIDSSNPLLKNTEPASSLSLWMKKACRRMRKIGLPSQSAL